MAQFKSGNYNELSDSETVTSFKRNVGFIASAALEGRKAGSKGEQEAANYIAGEFVSNGITILSDENSRSFGLRQENGDTLTSSNVLAYIPGKDPKLKDHFIVIGARLDNLGFSDVTVEGRKMQKIYFGANGNASGLAMAMELAKRLNSSYTARSVIIAAFGASAIDNAGAWYFLNRSFAKDAKNIDAMINLDMLGTASNGFYAFPCGNLDLIARIKKQNTTLQPIMPQIVNLEPCTSVHQAFYAQQIPSVMFTTGMYPQYNTDKDTPSILEYEDMERELEYLYSFSLTLANGDKPVFSPTDEIAKKKAAGKEVIVPYYECDFKPTFLNSSDPATFLKRWVYVYLKYPEEAVKEGIQGRVRLDFILDEKGKVTNVKVLKGVHPLLDEEAVKVVSASPDWKPGRVRGVKVKCEISLEVEFRLKQNK